MGKQKEQILRMPVLGSVPFVRLLLPFVIGILLALSPLRFVEHRVWLYSAIALFIIFLVLLLVVGLWQRRWLAGLPLNLLLLALGGAITSSLPSKSTIGTIEPIDCVLRLCEPTEDRGSSVRAVAQMQRVRTAGGWAKTNEKVILYFNQTDSMAYPLQYGSLLALRAQFNEVGGPQNPNEFDYGNYLARRGVFCTAYVPPSQWYLVGSDGSWFRKWSFNLRDYLITLLRSSGVEGQNLAVVTALVMGYKSLLDEETQQAFSASGTMHILAVSGLHVGILFTILSFALFFFDRVKHGRYPKAIILVLCLWAFALFTGLSPSVQRASLMFTLVVLGRALSRPTNIYNTLAASAFILLAANPMLIAELGFLLSYLAVLSIVFFYPQIYSWLFFRNRVLNWIWALMAVSLAAQLGTFPLSLFYFNQFPNFFLLGNLFAIPLATIILDLTILFVVISPIGLLTKPMGWLLNKIIGLLNYLVAAVDQLPHSTLNDIVLEPIQVLLLYGAIVLLGIVLIQKRFIFIALTLSLFIAFAGVRAFSIARSNAQREMVLFSHRGKTTIGFLNGNHLVVVSSSSEAPTKAIEGYIRAHRANENVEVYQMGAGLNVDKGWLRIGSYPQGCLIHFFDHTLFLPLGKQGAAPPLAKPQVDYLVFTLGNAFRTNELLDFVSAKHFVLDGSLPEWRADLLQRQLLPLPQPVHFLALEGALSVQIR